MAIDTKGVNTENTKTYKIWKSSPDADASMMLTPKSAMLIGNKNNFIAASELGVTLTGGVTMNCMSEQRRQGGLFVPMNDFVRMIPQTIVTPIPTQIPWPPIMFPLSILAGVGFFMAMLVK